MPVLYCESCPIQTILPYGVLLSPPLARAVRIPSSYIPAPRARTYSCSSSLDVARTIRLGLFDAESERDGCASRSQMTSEAVEARGAAPTTDVICFPKTSKPSRSTKSLTYATPSAPFSCCVRSSGT